MRRLFLIFLLMVSACSHMASTSHSDLEIPLGSTFDVNGRYLLGMGDRLEVNVVGRTDLSGVYTISPSGVINHPAASIKAIGLSLSTLKMFLEAKLGKYVKSPKVSLNIVDFVSLKYSIDGEVRNPGIYPVFRQSLSLAEAIAQAGGMSPYSKKKIYLTRMSDERSEIYEFNYEQLIMDARNPIYVERGDFIFIK